MTNDEHRLSRKRSATAAIAIVASVVLLSLLYMVARIAVSIRRLGLVAKPWCF